MSVTRLLLLLSVALSLSNPMKEATSKKIKIIGIVDVSRSITDENLTEFYNILKKLYSKVKLSQNNIKFEAITFAKTVTQIPFEKINSPVQLRTYHIKSRVKKEAPQEILEELQATNIEEALRFALAVTSIDYIPVFILFSDGNETVGSVLRFIQTTKALPKIYTYFPITTTSRKEVLIEELNLPNSVKVKEPFNIKAKLWSNYHGEVLLKLYQNGIIPSPDFIQKLNLKPGENIVEFSTRLLLPGYAKFKASLEEVKEDRFPENNIFEATTLALGKPLILYVEGEPSQAHPFIELLNNGGFDVELRSSKGFPTTFEELKRYHLVILSDVPREELTYDQMLLVKRYVREWGGGFIMVGGEKSFGPGGYKDTPIEEILPVRMETEREKEIPNIALVLVLDKSGSMTGRPIELAKEAAKASIELLNPQDLVEVIIFDSEPRRLVRMQKAINKFNIFNDIGKIEAGGGTAIFPALDMAYQDISITKAKKRHIILLSDGQSPKTGIPELLQELSYEGITVSTIGLGQEVDRVLMEEIGLKTGGRVYFTDDPNNIPRIFTKETSEVVKSSAVEDLIGVRAVSSDPLVSTIDWNTAPYIRGYISTQLKPPPAQLLLISDRGEPILARWRVGLGWALAYTTDVKSRWSADWFGWKGFGTLWSQLVRESMKQEERGNFPVEIKKEDDLIQLSVDAIDQFDNFINNLRGEYTVYTLEENSPPVIKGDFSQIGVGRYIAQFRLPSPGNYIIKGEFWGKDKNELIGSVTQSLVYPYPYEYRFPEDNIPLLRKLASITGGKFNPSVDEVTISDKTVSYWKSYYQFPLWVSLLLFFLDLILKRVRLPRS